MANAEKSQDASKNSPAASAVSSKKEAGSAGVTAESKDTQKAESSKVENKASQQPLPLLIDLGTNKDTFMAHEDILVKAELWAVQPVTLCLYPDQPEANFALDIYRAGYGKLNIPPAVVQLSREEMTRINRVKLEPGQMHRVIFNLKKLAPLPASFWKTGEYRAQVKFFLCGKTEQEEREIPAEGPLHLLILQSN